MSHKGFPARKEFLQIHLPKYPEAGAAVCGQREPS